MAASLEKGVEGRLRTEHSPTPALSMFAPGPCHFGWRVVCRLSNVAEYSVSSSVQITAESTCRCRFFRAHPAPGSRAPCRARATCRSWRRSGRWSSSPRPCSAISPGTRCSARTFAPTSASRRCARCARSRSSRERWRGSAHWLRRSASGGRRRSSRRRTRRWLTKCTGARSRRRAT